MTRTFVFEIASEAVRALLGGATATLHPLAVPGDMGWGRGKVAMLLVVRPAADPTPVVDVSGNAIPPGDY